MVLPCSVQNRDTQLFRDFEFLDERHSVTALTCPRERSIDELTRSTFSRKYRPSPAAAALCMPAGAARADRLRSILPVSSSSPPLRCGAGARARRGRARALPSACRRDPRARRDPLGRSPRARPRDGSPRVDGSRRAGRRRSRRRTTRPAPSGDGRRPRDARPGRGEHQALSGASPSRPRASSRRGRTRPLARAVAAPRSAPETPRRRRDPVPPRSPPTRRAPPSLTTSPPAHFHARSAPRGVSSGAGANERSERSERPANAPANAPTNAPTNAPIDSRTRASPRPTRRSRAPPALNAGAVALAARLAARRHALVFVRP